VGHAAHGELFGQGAQVVARPARAHRSQQRFELGGLEARLQPQHRDLAKVQRASQVARVRGGQLLLGGDKAVTGDAEGDGPAGREQLLEALVREAERRDQRRMAGRVGREVLPGDRQGANEFQQESCARRER
jgi:hypothetical protein